MVKTNKKGIHFAWIVLLGVCIVMGLARGGINNIGGLFMTSVMAELGCGAGEFMLYFSTASIVTVIFLPMAGRLIGKHDIRFLLVVGLILQAGSFALFGFMSSIWGWYILSIPLAIGGAFTTQLAGPVLIGNWFKKYNGVAVGIMMAAVGLFGTILQPVTGRLIMSQGWRHTYIILGVIVAAVGIPVVLLTIRKYPSQKGLRALGDEENSDSCSVSEKAVQGMTAEKARKSSAFWALVLFMFFVTAVACFSQHLPKYADQLGFDTTFAGEAMGFYMVGTLVGSITFGLLSDKIGAKITSTFALLCGMTAILMIIFLGAKPLLFCFAATLHGFSSAAVGTLGPLLTTSIFGQKEYGGIYSTVTMGTAVAGMLAPSGYGFIYDAMKDYVPVLWIICAMLGISLGCIFVAFEGKKKMEKA